MWRVLEGKAVVRVVDVDEPAVMGVAPAMVKAGKVKEMEPMVGLEKKGGREVTSAARKCCADILEESMRS